MYQIFDYLHSKNIKMNNIEKRIMNESDEKLETIVNALIDFVQASNSVKDSNSTNLQYKVAANSELSGGENSCRNLKCRLKNIDNLLRFSVLYADNVLIENPLEKYLGYELFDDMTRSDLIDDIKLLYYIRPFLEEGLLSLTISKNHFCTECYRNMLSPDSRFLKRLDSARESVKKQFLKEISVKYVNDDWEPVLEIKGPDDYISHGSIILVPSAEDVQKFADISGFKKQHTFSRYELIKTNLIDDIVEPIFNDIMNQNWRSNSYDARYVTNREFDFKILKTINDKETYLRSEALMKGISHSVPCIYNVNLESLIELRQMEKEAFLVYRDSINKTLKSINTSNEKEIREAFEDYVTSDLHKIDFIMKKTTEKLKKGINRNAIIASSLFGVGLLCGIIPKDVASLIAAFGGLGYLHATGEKITQLVDEPDEIIDNDYYFLWKVKSLE